MLRQRGATDALNQAADTAACMDWLREASILGLPVWSPIGDPAVDALLQHMVIAPGQGPALRDKGLEVLLGKEVFQINRDAERKGVRTVNSTQPIEINVYVKISDAHHEAWGGRRHNEKLYPLDSVLAFLDACTPERYRRAELTH